MESKTNKKINNFNSIGIKAVDEEQAFSRCFNKFWLVNIKKWEKWRMEKNETNKYWKWTILQGYFKRLLYECHREARMSVSIKIIPQRGNARWTSNRWITDRNNVNWLRWNKTKQNRAIMNNVQNMYIIMLLFVFSVSLIFRRKMGFEEKTGVHFLDVKFILLTRMGKYSQGKR